METIRIATLNINGMTSPTKIAMMENFLHTSEIDILLVQEVTKQVLHNLQGYQTLYNIGTNCRGTAIIAKQGITFENITRIPSGHAIAAKFNDYWLINIYAPSRMACRQEREAFYTCELSHILSQPANNILMAGDFNCTLEKGNATGTLNQSRGLTEIIRGMELRDVWNRTPESPGYTHYSINGASRLDRIYVTKELYQKKQGLETKIAAFTDHLAICLHLKQDKPIPQMGRGYWKLDSTLFDTTTITQKLTTLWGHLQQQKRCFPNKTMWWDRYVKRRLTRFMQREQAERYKEYRDTENFYYSCIYELLQSEHT
jgi:exonuclease III